MLLKLATLALASLFLSSSLALADALKPEIDLAPIKNLLSQPEKDIDLARSRLVIESYMDPSIDIDGLLKTIDGMAEDIKKVPLYSETTEGKLNGLIQYLYHPGPWNNNQPFQYDLDDPLGTSRPRNKLVSNYLKTRKGNCVSMPMLVQALGERVGLDMSLSTAPMHLFVRLNDNGDIYNIETTAGGLKADSSYIKEFEIAFHAMRSKIYLQSLTKKETLAVMLNGLGALYSERGDLKHAQEIGDMMLEQYPNYVNAMFLQGNIWRQRLKREIDSVKLGYIPDTPTLRSRLDMMVENNLAWFEKAESLGWREPPSDYDERYLQMIEEAKKQK